jgi:hypothetical protein
MVVPRQLCQAVGFDWVERHVAPGAGLAMENIIAMNFRAYDLNGPRRLEPVEAVIPTLVQLNPLRLHQCGYQLSPSMPLGLYEHSSWGGRPNVWRLQRHGL